CRREGNHRLDSRPRLGPILGCPAGRDRIRILPGARRLSELPFCRCCVATLLRRSGEINVNRRPAAHLRGPGSEQAHSLTSTANSTMIQRVFSRLHASGDSLVRSRRKILHVVGARPNYMKVAPLVDALRSVPEISHTLLNTGQHYDEAMAGVFL